MANINAWAPANCRIGQWIQVSCEDPQYWTDVILQGRGDQEQWVTSLKIAFTINGRSWENIENGRVFEANKDNSSKVRISFYRPVHARGIRLYPQTWETYMALRFDAIYLETN